MRKLSFLMAVSLLLPLCSPLCAYYYGDDAVCSHYNPYEYEANDYCPTTSYGNCCRENFTMHGDFLYWWACPEGFYYALKTPVYPLFEGTPPEGMPRKFDGEEKVLDYAYEGEAGFRFGVRYQPCDQNWEMALNWTYFSPEQSRSTSLDKESQSTNSSTQTTGSTLTGCDEPFVLIPFSGFPLEQVMVYSVLDSVKFPLNQIHNVYDKVKGHHELHLNMVDLEFAQTYMPSCYLSIRPHLDLRFAAIQQKLKIKSEGTVRTSLEASNGEVSNLRLADFATRESFNNDFNGVGPRIGLDTSWDFGCCLGLYGNFAVSCLYGDRKADVKAQACTFDSQEDVGSENFNPIDTEINLKRKLDRCCARAITDVGIGFYWSQCVCGGLSTLTLKAGWEHHYFFNQNVAHSISAVTIPPSIDRVETLNNFHYTMEEKANDLSVQGVTVTVALDF